MEISPQRSRPQVPVAAAAAGGRGRHMITKEELSNSAVSSAAQYALLLASAAALICCCLWGGGDKVPNAPLGEYSPFDISGGATGNAKEEETFGVYGVRAYVRAHGTEELFDPETVSVAVAARRMGRRMGKKSGGPEKHVKDRHAAPEEKAKGVPMLGADGSVVNAADAVGDGTCPMRIPNAPNANDKKSSSSKSGNADGVEDDYAMAPHEEASLRAELTMDSNRRQLRDAVFATRAALALYEAVVARVVDWREAMVGERGLSAVPQQQLPLLTGPADVVGGGDGGGVANHHGVGGATSLLADLLGGSAVAPAAVLDPHGKQKAGSMLLQRALSLRQSLLGTSKKNDDTTEDGRSSAEDKGRPAIPTTMTSASDSVVFSSNTSMIAARAADDSDAVVAAEGHLGALPRLMLKAAVLIDGSLRTLNELTGALVNAAARLSSVEVHGTNHDRIEKAEAAPRTKNTRAALNAGTEGGRPNDGAAVLEGRRRTTDTDKMSPVAPESHSSQQQQQQHRPLHVPASSSSSSSFSHATDGDKRFHQTSFADPRSDLRNFGGGASTVSEVSQAVSRAGMAAESSFADSAAVEYSSLLSPSDAEREEANAAAVGGNGGGQPPRHRQHASIADAATFMKNAADKLRYQLANWAPTAGVREGGSGGGEGAGGWGWAPLPFRSSPEEEHSGVPDSSVGKAAEEEPLIVIGLCTVSRGRAKYLASTIRSLIDGDGRLDASERGGGSGINGRSKGIKNGGNIRIVVFNANNPPQANTEATALVGGASPYVSDEIPRGFLRVIDRSSSFVGPSSADAGAVEAIIAANAPAFVGERQLEGSSELSSGDDANGRRERFAQRVRDAMNPMSPRYYRPSSYPFSSLALSSSKGSGGSKWRTIDDEYNAKYNLLAPSGGSDPLLPAVARRWGDDERRLRWRAKQALDAAFLLDFAGAAHRHLYRPPQTAAASASSSSDFSFFDSAPQAAAGAYFLMLEDDIDTTRRYITKLRVWLRRLNAGEVGPGATGSAGTERASPASTSSSSRWGVASFYNPWDDVTDGQSLPPNKFFGMIGQLFRVSDLPVVAAFLRRNYDQSPLDWLMVDFLRRHRWSMVVHTPSLFEHVGAQSSLDGKAQPAHAADFQRD